MGGGAFGQPAGGLGFPGAGLRERSLLMDADGGGSDQVGLPRDFVWGFLMGFFLGVIMLFWLWERSVGVGFRNLKMQFHAFS